MNNYSIWDACAFGPDYCMSLQPVRPDLSSDGSFPSVGLSSNQVDITSSRSMPQHQAESAVRKSAVHSENPMCSRRSELALALSRFVLRAHLSLEQLQTRSSTRTNMTQLVLLPGIRYQRSRISTTNNNLRTTLGSFDTCVQKCIGSFGKCREFEYTSGSVPEDRLGFRYRLSEEVTGFGTGVETHPVGGNTGFVGCAAGLHERASERQRAREQEWDDYHWSKAEILGEEWTSKQNGGRE